MKLKTSLLFNYFHYYLFFVVVGLLSLESPFFLLLYVPLFIFIKSYKNKSFLILVSIIIVSFTFYRQQKNKQLPINNEFLVIEYKDYDYKRQYILKQNNQKYLIYINENLKIGDVVLIDFDVRPFYPKRTPTGFNQERYYASKKIYYELKVKNIKVIDHVFHMNQIKEHLRNYFNNYPPTIKAYIELFLFNENTFEKIFIETKKILGISHLFALSGLHVHLIILFIRKVLNYFKIKRDNFIILPILFVYLFLTGYGFSLLRATLMVFIQVIFKRFKVTPLDSLSISFLIILLTNSYAYYDYGFILSFLVSFFIITSPKIKGISGVLITNVIAYFSGLLIVSNINGGIYLLSLFTSIIASLVFPFLMMPVIFMGIIPFIAPLSEIILSFINRSLIEISFSPLLSMPYCGLVLQIIYLVFLIFLIVSSDFKIFIQRSCIFLTFLVFIYYKNNFDPKIEVIILDVGQGNGTVIKNAYNKGYIVIDANKGTYDYLKTLGTITIDYLFITHGDYDHISDAEKILRDFKVHHFCVGLFDQTNHTKALKSFGAVQVKKGDRFIIEDVIIDILGPVKEFHTSNNNSLILKVTIVNEVYLFTGDQEKEAEEALIKSYKNLLKSDYLHIAHHGSSSSTSALFLEYVNPKEAFISVGRYNSFNHPSPEVIKRLEDKNIKIYLTSQHTSIKKSKIKLLGNFYDYKNLCFIV